MRLKPCAGTRPGCALRREIHRAFHPTLISRVAPQQDNEREIMKQKELGILYNWF